MVLLGLKRTWFIDYKLLFCKINYTFYHWVPSVFARQRVGTVYCLTWRESVSPITLSIVLCPIVFVWIQVPWLIYLSDTPPKIFWVFNTWPCGPEKPLFHFYSFTKNTSLNMGHLYGIPLLAKQKVSKYPTAFFYFSTDHSHAAYIVK